MVPVLTPVQGIGLPCSLGHLVTSHADFPAMSRGMTGNPNSGGPSRAGHRSEDPSFPRRGQRGRLVLSTIAMLSGLVLLVSGLLGTGWLAAAQLGVGTFAATLGGFGVAGARLLRTCAGCGSPPRIATARLPLHAADPMITAIELADPERLERIDAPRHGEPTLRLELLHCPRCRDVGWLRTTSRVQGVPVRVGPTWVLLGSFLEDVLVELRRRRGRRQSTAGSP